MDTRERILFSGDSCQSVMLLAFPEGPGTGKKDTISLIQKTAGKIIGLSDQGKCA